MKQQNPSPYEGGALSPEEVEAVVRRACAQCDAAVGRALGVVFRGLAAGRRRFRRAVDEAYRLRALATLDDRRLSALGLARGDLPGIVYGWHTAEAPARLSKPGPRPARGSGPAAPKRAA